MQGYITLSKRTTFVSSAFLFILFQNHQAEKRKHSQAILVRQQSSQRSDA